jgi:hypothetical protein
MQATDHTFGEIRPKDVLIDKTEKHWIILEPRHDGGTVTFKLADPEQPTIAVHVLTKPSDDPCRLLQAPPFDQAARDTEIAEREAEVDEASKVPPPPEPPTLTEVEASLGLVGTGNTVTITAEEEHKLKHGESFEVPAFTDMTPPEQQSHLYFLHGIYPFDVKTEKQRRELHDQSHDGGNDFKPHDHQEPTT